MDDSQTNFFKETLLMHGNAVGLCLTPDLRDPKLENKDFMGFYQMWASIPEQTHSCNVAVAERYRRFYPDTDALIAFEPDVAVGVKTADCVPILVYAPDQGAVGAIHAGWKGTLGGIVDNVLDLLEDRGVDVTQLKVAFGPSISKEIYEVDRTMAESFVEAGFGAYVSYPYGAEEKPHIDLQGVNTERFIRRGVLLKNIKNHDRCSFSSRMEDGTPMYASHRRSGGALARMLTSIMLLDR